MCGVLALTFIVVTATEIAILVKVGGLLGGWATFGLVIATGFAGAALARHQGAAVLQRLRTSLAGGDPSLALVDGALVLAAGVTLLSPGFLTDATGLLLLVPMIRAPVAKRLHRYLAARVVGHVERHVVIDLADLERAARGGGDGETIDVEATERDADGDGDGDVEDPPPPGVIDV